MELAFEDLVLLMSVLAPLVSILLVVELAFEAFVCYCFRFLDDSFNPSCSGIGF